MRERVIRIGVLGIVFVLAVMISSHITNKGNADMTAEMASATFPTVSFEAEGLEVNLLAGHKNEMEISAMRDTITPVNADGSLKVNLQAYEQAMDSILYEVYTLNGTEMLIGGTEKEPGEVIELQLGATLVEQTEAILKLEIQFGEGQSAYYYTRVTTAEDLHFSECLTYVKELHTNMLQGENEDEIKKVMEADSQGDNTTLQHVTIHSDIDHSMWGKLSPQIVGEVRYDVKETKSAYTSVLLSYQVQCAGDNNEEELYNVKEFFKVRCVDGEYYLLSYDRTMEEVFDGSKVVLMSKGINLGLTTQDAQYKANQDGTIVAFVQANELWSYNKEEDEFALVFSFADAVKEDVRNHFDDHSLRILSMESNGNLTFAVYGYMNRGTHEGESGIAIYYFNLSQNIVEEKAFIPSLESKVSIEKELGKMAYYNDEKNVLYVLIEGSLRKFDFEEDEEMILLEGLTEGEYVTSDDGHLLAYRNPENPSEAKVLNFQEDSTRSVTVLEGETIQPIGFVSGDFVYGAAKEEDAAVTASGETATGMYKLEICDSENTVLKTYQIDGTYILEAEAEGNMITLSRAVKQNGVYKEIVEDYITNNEEKANNVSLQSYWTDLKETQFRLVFDDGIDNKKAKVLKPKQVLFERDTTIAVEQDAQKEQYAVYGLGEIVGMYEEAGEAIQAAKETSGVVISPEQRYIWEDGNRVSWYRNFEMSAFRANAGESALAASVRAVLAYEGKTVDAVAEMASKSVLEIMNEQLDGEAVCFRDCSAKDMFYLIDKGTPVIAMTDSSNAVVLIGYDAKTVTYIDPSNGAVRSKPIEALDEIMSGAGNTFLGYVK